MQKLSDLTISNLKTPGYHWDALPGFGIRIGKQRKTFVIVKQGRRQSLGVYPHLSLADARHMATQLLYTTTTVTKRTTINQAVTAYLDQLTVKPRTTADYTRLLRLHILPSIGTKDINQITANDILRITDKLSPTPSEKRHAHVVMNTFFNWCVPRFISANPMTGLKAPKPKHRDRTLSNEELKRLWQAAGDLGNYGTILKVCILLATRKSEPVNRITLNEHTVTFHETKNGLDHTLPITPLMHSLISQIQPSNGWSKNKARLDNLLKFNEPFTIHDLRRTTASNLCRFTDPWMAERILNHKPPKLQQIYNRHDFTEAMRKPLEEHQNWLLKLVENS